MFVSALSFLIDKYVSMARRRLSSIRITYTIVTRIHLRLKMSSGCLLQRRNNVSLRKSNLVPECVFTYDSSVLVLSLDADLC